MNMKKQWYKAGAQAIAGPESVRYPLPWAFKEVVFRCAWEYPVVDFETEVGFWTEAIGLSTLALDNNYALFTTQDDDFTFACRRRESSIDLSGHILCFMTRDIEMFRSALQKRLPDGDVTTRQGSSVQTVLGVKTPAGLQVDIWEFPDD